MAIGKCFRISDKSTAFSLENLWVDLGGILLRKFVGLLLGEGVLVIEFHVEIFFKQALEDFLLLLGTLALVVVAEKLVAQGKSFGLVGVFVLSNLNEILDAGFLVEGQRFENFG